MSYFSLTKEQAITLSKQQTRTQEVKLSSINFNWGPPISGRYNDDGMIIWAKVAVDSPGKLFLQGTKDDSIWDIDIEFNKIDVFEELNSNRKYVLYTLDLGNSQYSFPKEFVLRFDTQNDSYYDNNAGANYKITPFSNFGGSAYSLEENAIVDFGYITNPKFFFKELSNK